MNEKYAVLSSQGKYSSFSYGDFVIRFRTSEALIKYTQIKKWDNGYLIVTADYKNLGLTEEYIDISSILKELSIDEEKILTPIKEVKIEY